MRPRPFARSAPVTPFGLSVVILLVIFQGVQLLGCVSISVRAFDVGRVRVDLLLGDICVYSCESGC